MGNLKGKRALVTGGGQGLGCAIVEHVLAAGVDVVVHYFSSESGARELQARGRALGCRVEIFKADLTSESEANALVEAAVTALGGLDILVNNAGDLVQRRTIETIDADSSPVPRWTSTAASMRLDSLRSDKNKRHGRNCPQAIFCADRFR